LAKEYPKEYFRRKKRELIERRKAERMEDYEERRDLALAKGVRTDYVVCPLCLRNVPLRFWRKKPLEERPFLIEARYSYGRRSGFFLNEDESLRLGDPELMEKHGEIVRGVCRDVRKIYNELRRLYPELMGVKRRGRKGV
jgi:hypothetical protein